MKVLKSWGASGEVVLSRMAGDPEDLKSQEPVFIEFDGIPVPFYIESVEPKGSRFIVRFQDVDTQAFAEELVGREVTLSESGEEEEETLIGMRIRDARTRRTVGSVVDFSDYGGNVVITVETESGDEILLPLHEELVRSVRDDVITLEIPEGLI